VELTPEIILFYFSHPFNDLLVKLLREQPDLLLIGVDPSSDDVLVLKGQRSRVMSGGELSKRITSKTSALQLENERQILNADTRQGNGWRRAGMNNDIGDPLFNAQLCCGTASLLIWNNALLD
jgi:hypothetical protein